MQALSATRARFTVSAQAREYRHTSGALSLTHMGDVDLLTTPPIANDYLKWDATAGQWAPGTKASVDYLHEMGDVINATAAQTFLAYDGADWDGQATKAVGGLADVDTTGVSAGHGLFYSSGLPGFAASAPTLSGVTDVTLGTPLTGQSLAWSGAAWVPGGIIAEERATTSLLVGASPPASTRAGHTTLGYGVDTFDGTDDATWIDATVLGGDCTFEKNMVVIGHANTHTERDNVVLGADNSGYVVNSYRSVFAGFGSANTFSYGTSVHFDLDGAAFGPLTASIGYGSDGNTAASLGSLGAGARVTALGYSSRLAAGESNQIAVGFDCVVRNRTNQTSVGANATAGFNTVHYLGAGVDGSSNGSGFAIGYGVVVPGGSDTFCMRVGSTQLNSDLGTFSAGAESATGDYLHIFVDQGGGEVEYTIPLYTSTS